MRLDVNDLLEENELMRLTAEAVDAPARSQRFHGKRLAALAACGALVVSLANFDAIATGVERAWRVVSGVGAVPGEGEVLVQAEKAELREGDRVYRLVNGYYEGGLIHFTAEVLCYDDVRREDGSYPDLGLTVEVTGGGERCPVYWGEGYDNEGYEDRSSTALQGREEWEATASKMGYGDLGRRFEGAQSAADYAVAFQAQAGETYEVELSVWNADGGTLPLERRIGTLELKLEPSRAQTAETYRRETEWGTLSVLVSGDGTKLQAVMEQPEEETERVSRVWPLSPRFVDAQGNRYRAVPIQLAMDGGRQSQELVIEEEPEAPIVAVEIGGLALMTEDLSRPVSSEDRFRAVWDYDFSWTFELS